MKVGMLHHRSGAAGLWGPSMDAAAVVAAAEINDAGGILGDDVELVFADCGWSTRDAFRAVDDLMEIEQVEAIVGSHASLIRDPVSSRISSRIPYIYTPQYEGAACGPSTVATGDTDRELLEPAIRWLREEKAAQRFFFVGNDYIWPRMALETTKALMALTGSHFIGQAMVPVDQQDHFGLLETIRRSKAQVVIMALLGHSAVLFNRAFAAAGMDEKILRFGLIIDETVICGIGAHATTNLFTASSYFADHHSRSNDRFLERYHDAFGTITPPVSAASIGYYEGLHLLAGLSRKLGTHDGPSLAAHLSHPVVWPSRKDIIKDRAVRGSSAVHIGAAEGVTLKVVATMRG
ncbi:substrate-binding domain-containing protein [Rhizobium sp. CC-YZS058]|uniref:substrate-binding domain-containing protein n=1 Tax=Rhizobium sp. CC-YZS058 TaxID=3042153 RepID=UPI002B06231A|nr:substrate-binding domain-containing protein [Rhizobium sp. CC-YZS058]MEA3536647.1 substrate-binding domain-containing protein [Rhizobium sp. CC-YZS058]